MESSSVREQPANNTDARGSSQTTYQITHARPGRCRHYIKPAACVAAERAARRRPFCPFPCALLTRDFEHVETTGGVVRIDVVTLVELARPADATLRLEPPKLRHTFVDALTADRGTGHLRDV